GAGYRDVGLTLSTHPDRREMDRRAATIGPPGNGGRTPEAGARHIAPPGRRKGRCGRRFARGSSRRERTGLAGRRRAAPAGVITTRLVTLRNRIGAFSHDPTMGVMTQRCWKSTLLG